MKTKKNKPVNLAALSLKDARFRKRIVKSKKIYDRKRVSK